jgi:hypothetical protein
MVDVFLDTCDECGLRHTRLLPIALVDEEDVVIHVCFLCFHVIYEDA